MVFLGPFGPPFYELGNFVKILDPPPIPKNFPSETWELCEFFLTPPLLGIFPKFSHVRVLKASLRYKSCCGYLVLPVRGCITFREGRTNIFLSITTLLFGPTCEKVHPR